MDKIMVELIKAAPVGALIIIIAWMIMKTLTNYFKYMSESKNNNTFSGVSEYNSLMKEVMEMSKTTETDHIQIKENIQRLKEKLKYMEQRIEEQTRTLKKVQEQLEENKKGLDEINSYLEDLSIVMEKAITHNDEMTSTAKNISDQLKEFQENQNKILDKIDNINSK